MEKNWILTIGIDKFYLTEEQKDFYLESVGEGSKYVVIDNKYLGVNFQSLVSKVTVEETKMLESGKSLCDYGKWHWNLRDCACSWNYEIEDGRAVKVLQEEEDG